MMTKLEQTVTAAQAELSPRAEYARDVVAGRRRWSGADLMGKARRYGARYAEQRGRALAALHRAGGFILTVDAGRSVTAVRVGVDDFGRALYQTPDGPAVQAAANRAALVAGGRS